MKPRKSLCLNKKTGRCGRKRNNSASDHRRIGQTAEFPSRVSTVHFFCPKPCYTLPADISNFGCSMGDFELLQSLKDEHQLLDRKFKTSRGAFLALFDSLSESEAESHENENGCSSSATTVRDRATFGPISPSADYFYGQLSDTAPLFDGDSYVQLKRQCSLLEHQLKIERNATQAATLRVAELERICNGLYFSVRNDSKADASETAKQISTLEAQALAALLALETLSHHIVTAMEPNSRYQSVSTGMAAALASRSASAADVRRLSSARYAQELTLKDSRVSALLSRSRAEMQACLARGRELARSRRERTLTFALRESGGHVEAPLRRREEYPPSPPTQARPRPSRAAVRSTGAFSSETSASDSDLEDELISLCRQRRLQPPAVHATSKLKTSQHRRAEAAAAEAAEAAQTRSALASLLALIHRKDAELRASAERLAAAEGAAAQLQRELSSLRRPPPPPPAAAASSVSVGTSATTTFASSQGRFGFYASRLVPAAAAVAAAAAAAALIGTESIEAGDDVMREAQSHHYQAAASAASSQAGRTNPGGAGTGAWRAARDAESGDAYFYNVETREVRWAQQIHPAQAGGHSADRPEDSPGEGKPGAADNSSRDAKHELGMQ